MIPTELYKKLSENNPNYNIKNLDQKYLIRKKWGFSYEIISTQFFGVTCNYIVTGGYSSWHLHKYKWNIFYAIEGVLEITFEASGEKRKLLIGPEEDKRRAEIVPGIWHQFKCIKNCILIEVYLARHFRDDIIRDIEQEGGLNV